MGGYAGPIQTSLMWLIVIAAMLQVQSYILHF